MTPLNYRHYDEWRCNECSQYHQSNKICEKYNVKNGGWEVCDSFRQANTCEQCGKYEEKLFKNDDGEWICDDCDYTERLEE